RSAAAEERTLSPVCSPEAIWCSPPQSVSLTATPRASARSSAAEVLPVPVAPSKRKAQGQGASQNAWSCPTAQGWPRISASARGRYFSRRVPLELLSDMPFLLLRFGGPGFPAS